MASVFDHLHLKRNTAGSSNELSFDVLDAASAGYTKKSSSAVRLPLKARQDKGSYHGVTGASTLSGQEEVERRKKARRRHNRQLKILMGTVVLGVSFVFLFVVYQHYLEVQDYSTRFAALVDQFNEEDAFLAEVDAAMQELDDESQADTRAQMTQEIPSIKEALERISTNAASARPLAIDEEDVVALDQILEASQARQGMVDAAQATFALVAERDQRAHEMTSVWNGVADKWQSAEQASNLANSALTEKQTREARDATAAAQEQFEHTLLDLQNLAVVEPAVGVSAQQEYLATKIASLKAGVETADALLEGDRKAAKTKNDEYNELDSKSAMLALALPPTLDAAVEDAYALQLAATTQSYNQSRDQAITADSLVRDYLSHQ